MDQSAETAPRRGRPRQTKAEASAVRARIIEAARTLFARAGYEGVSMRKLADLAGLSPAALYGYFPDKRTLLRFHWEETFEALSRELEKAAKRKKDPRARAEALALTFIRFWLARPDDYRAIFLIEDKPSGPAQNYFAQSSPSLHGLELIASAMADAFPHQDPEMATQVLLSALQGVAHNLITIPEFPWISAEKLARTTIRTVLGGLNTEKT